MVREDNILPNNEQDIRDSWMIAAMCKHAQELYENALEKNYDGIVYEARAFYTSVRLYKVDEELINFGDLGDDYRALEYKINQNGYKLNAYLQTKLTKLKELFDCVRTWFEEELNAK